MSTPRHEPLMPPETIWLQIGEDEPGVENKSFSEFRDEVTWCWHKINDNDLEYRLVAEGVAAPLEPRQRRIIQAARDADWQQVILNGGPPCFYIGDDGDERFCLRAESWHYPQAHPFTSLEDLLAAVSKNVKEAYDREHAWLNNAATEANCDLNEVAGAIIQLKASVEQLSGDLKAIQQDYTNEKKRAENLQEELAAMRTRWNFTLKGEDEALRECRRLEKEISALRETK